MVRWRLPKSADVDRACYVWLSDKQTYRWVAFEIGDVLGPKVHIRTKHYRIDASKFGYGEDPGTRCRKAAQVESRYHTSGVTLLECDPTRIPILEDFLLVVWWIEWNEGEFPQGDGAIKRIHANIAARLRHNQ